MQGNHAQEIPTQFQLQAQLDSIVTRELTVDGIATFAEDVIRDLSGLSTEVTATYKDSNPDESAIGMPLEDTAFMAYGLPLLSELLEAAQQQDAKIKNAGSFIANNMRLVDTVITPPDEQDAFVATGTNTYRKPGLKNRLQTLLYLVQELGVNLDDISIKKGKVLPTFVRDESYVTVEIPGLQRVVYVCDEEHNASYIFDSEGIGTIGLTVEELDAMTKKEKNELIEHYPLVGRRVLQRSHWVNRLKMLLLQEFTEETSTVSIDESDEWKGFWFNLEDGKHYGNLVNLEEKLTVGRTIIERFINEHVAQARVRSGGVRWTESDGYAYEDLLAIEEIQRIVAMPLTERSGEWAGFYQDPQTGHRIGTILSLERKLGVHGVAILAAAERQNLSPIQLRSATRLGSDGYSYEGLLKDEKLQELLRVPRLEKKGEWKGFWTDQKGFHWGPISSIRAALGVHYKIIKELVEAGEFVSIRTRSTSKATDSYRLEDFVNQPKIVELTSAKLVEADGEWQGFYTDPETGTHWAPLRTISNRLGTNDEQLRGRMKDKEVAAMPVRVRSKRTAGGVYTAYCYEQIVS